MTNWFDSVNLLKIETRAFINGQYQAAITGETIEDINPATECKIADVALCGLQDVNLAVQCARTSFESGIWSQLAPRVRGNILKRFAAKIAEHQDELALLESLDVGKPIADSKAIDVAGCVYCFEWYAECIDKVPGEVAPVNSKLLGLVTREPMGVVAAVVPCNFPLLMATWKIAPALAAGNSVILKPSQKSPLTAIRIAGLAHEAGIPSGVFQVLPGDSHAGQHLASHMDVDCIAFTGSTMVGRFISSYAAQSNLKHVWLELGGKSPNIIFDDCDDIEKAADAAAGAIYYNVGQICTAGSRVLVHENIKEAFLKEFKKAVQKYIPGNPLDEKTKMGPLVDEEQYNRVLSYIEIGKAEGKLVCGGKTAQVNGKGFFVEPTAFEVVANSRLAKDEIFGPVLSIISFKDEAEAILIANDTLYGLAAGIWTSNMSRAHRVSRSLRVGTVWVNCYDEGNDMNLPFGGFKQSGNSRDRSIHALEKYTELKSTLIKL